VHERNPKKSSYKAGGVRTPFLIRNFFNYAHAYATSPARVVVRSPIAGPLHNSEMSSPLPGIDLGPSKERHFAMKAAGRA
jgi:hypothetical protein